MLLELTLTQLDIGHVPHEQAEEMGHLGYLQWLGALPGDAGYLTEVRRALAMAQPFAEVSPAVGVFCRLLRQSAASMPMPLTVRLPSKTRRGGARGRRSVH